LNKEDINKSFQSLRVEGYDSKDIAWQKLQQRIQEAGTTKATETLVISLHGDTQPEVQKSKRFTLWYTAAAIAAVLVAAVMIYSPNEIVDVNAGFASIEQCELPDGSIVHLNASSKLKYDAKAWEEERKVWLVGEGEFEVEKGSKFTVVSESGEVTVLGTSFNVYDRNGVYEVSCMTGKVAVENELNKEIIIPGEQVVENDAGRLIKKAFVGKPAGWLDGEYYFDEVDAVRVFTILESTYGIEIDYSNWADAPYSIYAGPVVTSSLPKALELISGETGSLSIEFIDLGDNKYEVRSLDK